VLLLPPGGEDEYVEALKLAAAANQPVQTHAVGDETIDVILRAYERVNAEYPLKGRRWAIMHVFLPTAGAIRKMADLGVMATAQDHPCCLATTSAAGGATRGPPTHPDPGAPRRRRACGRRHGWPRAAGRSLPVPVVDDHRQTLNGYALGPEQAITAREALKLYTINNAILMGTERDRGSIEAGKLADLVVLSQDILAVPPDAIRNTKALMTVVGGRIVHRTGM
jgi:predicted amidohydrolase YtcJ